jgi:histidine ammonia-lyase
LTGAYWLDLRKSQNPARAFGASPTAVWTAFRAVLPVNGVGPTSATQPIHEIAAAFIRSHAAADFYKDDAREPGEGVQRHPAE